MNITIKNEERPVTMIVGGNTMRGIFRGWFQYSIANDLTQSFVAGPVAVVELEDGYTARIAAGDSGYRLRFLDMAEKLAEYDWSDEA